GIASCGLIITGPCLRRFGMPCGSHARGRSGTARVVGEWGTGGANEVNMSSAAITLGDCVGSAQATGRAFMSSGVPDATPIVFVLDEDAAIRESLERSIRREGWRCATFASAQEFVTCRPAGVPNCLVLDASLPGTSALELQKRIAAERPGTSIIFVAGHFDVNTTVKAIKAGAVEFFKKPFRDDVLLTAIREALERSRF